MCKMVYSKKCCSTSKRRKIMACESLVINKIRENKYLDHSVWNKACDLKFYISSCFVNEENKKKHWKHWAENIILLNNVQIKV